MGCAVDEVRWTVVDVDGVGALVVRPQAQHPTAGLMPSTFV